MEDLNSFLEKFRDEHIRIRKSVKLDQVGALVGQADETVVFENPEGYPDFRLVDQLFVNRRAQARVLGCEPDEVVRTLSEVIRKGPRPLKPVDSGPCQDRQFTGEEIDLGMLPIVRHTALDPYPYTTGFAVQRERETGQYNAMYPRTGVLGKREMVTSYVTPTAGRMFAGYKEAGEPMPQALVIGCHPAWELAACYSAPHRDWWELELFEAITGRRGEIGPRRSPLPGGVGVPPPSRSPGRPQYGRRRSRHRR